MRAAWSYFVSFEQAARDFAKLAQTKLTMPVLTMGGAKANGEVLGKQGPLVATNATSVVLPNTGHWMMEENPSGTIEALLRFVAMPSTLSEMRFTPMEVRANQTGANQIGSSNLPGVNTKVLAGDPSKTGLYTIILSVPANTTIAAHSHRDDRMATVVSGTWRFGYGDRFDEGAEGLTPGERLLRARGRESFRPNRRRASSRSDLGLRSNGYAIFRPCYSTKVHPASDRQGRSTHGDLYRSTCRDQPDRHRLQALS